ncbi:MAG TPA: GIY-YIG nuclease family protein [Tepidisphaeraceae bacterium]|jgi:putative endonuclease
MREFFVYILFNHSRTLYIGVTNDLVRRVYEHQHKLVGGFTSRYNITQLAYYENYPTALAAIEREKQLKGWKRDKKVALIEGANPHWGDLSGSLNERFECAMSLAGSARPEVPGKILRCVQDDGLQPSGNDA